MGPVPLNMMPEAAPEPPLRRQNRGYISNAALSRQNRGYISNAAHRQKTRPSLINRSHRNRPDDRTPHSNRQRTHHR